MSYETNTNAAAGIYPGDDVAYHLPELNTPLWGIVKDVTEQEVTVRRLGGIDNVVDSLGVNHGTLRKSTELEIATRKAQAFDSLIEMVGPQGWVNPTLQAERLRGRISKLVGIEETLCDSIRGAADAYGYNFCEDGLRAFCDDAGVDFTYPKVMRRGMILLDLSSDLSWEEQETAMGLAYQAIAAAEIAGVRWGHVSMDDVETIDGEEWDTRPDPALEYEVTQGRIQS